jgi:hypothetical protein
MHLAKIFILLFKDRKLYRNHVISKLFMPQRNQVRFVKDAEEGFVGDNAHERDCF